MALYDRTTIHDAGQISSFTSRVYGWMTAGLGLTATVAYMLWKSGVYMTLMPFWWLWAFGTLGIAMAINFSINRISIGGMIGLLLAYAGLEGLLFGTMLPLFAAAYGGQVIWTAFATGAAIFALATGYGMFTKADLTSLGKILSLGLIGLIGVSFLFMIASFFVHLSWAHLLISYLGLVIFVGLTAYDSQTIRSMAIQAGSDSTASYKLSLIMALKMYINVIMIFWYLLQIFSRSRR